MSEKCLRHYDCDEILEFLDSTYFHPSRDKEFPSTQIKYAAQCALLRLWNMYLIEIGDEVYYSQDIRRIVYEEMLPEDLDNAVRLCVLLGKTDDLDFMSQMIFLQIVSQLNEYEPVLKSIIVCPPRKKNKILTEVDA